MAEVEAAGQSEQTRASATPQQAAGQPSATPQQAAAQPSATPQQAADQPSATPRQAAAQPSATPRQATPEQPVTPQDQATKFLAGYGRMHLIRRFETSMHRLFLAGEVHGTTHLGAGQEAVAVGVCMALEPDDYVAGTYRGHGHALAKGTEPEPLIAEMLGRASGVCGGRAGSMNVVDIEHGLIGCYGIVGGSIAGALGAALSGKRQGRVAAAFFGDGAVNQAYFHECLNMAKVFLLPEVFVCENNFYGEFTAMASVTAGADIAGRARAYEVPSAVVDGNDLWAVYEAASAAVNRARSGDGPTLLECQTYRHYGHSKGDPAPYRPKDEVEQWLARDPLKIAKARLQQDGITEQQLDAVEAEAAALIERAVEAALAAPYPDPDASPASEFSR